METREKKHSVILESHLLVMHGKVNRIEEAFCFVVLAFFTLVFRVLRQKTSVFQIFAFGFRFSTKIQAVVRIILVSDAVWGFCLFYLLYC